MSHRKTINRLLFGLLWATAVLSVACSEDECKTNADCGAGEVCKGGECVAASSEDSASDSSETPGTGSAAPEHPTDTSVGDRPTDTGDIEDSESARDTASEGTTDSMSTNDTESDSVSQCLPVKANGDACNEDCECRSEHCEGGICCSDGECCNSIDDCENDLCVNVGCRGDHYCAYGTTAYPCGSRDSNGAETCTGNNVCNGDGECISLQTVCSPYAENLTGTYTCSAAGAEAECYSSCTPANQTVNCAAGATCIQGVCVSSGAAMNGELCSENEECASGHCDHNICCSEGTCCRTADDCPDICLTASCADYSCTTTVYRPCGASDEQDNDRCSGANRCDGAGNCIEVIEACSPFVGDNTYTCTTNESVEENCYSDCEFSSQCADGFSCNDSGDCVSDGTLENGEACSDNAICISGHCQNGYCCDHGDCCASASDCSGDLCGSPVCDDDTCGVGNFVACGEADETGDQTCRNNGRCDGGGGCLTLTRCDGPYSAVPETYTCSIGERVEEGCYTSCNTDTECNPGYYCDTDAQTCTEIDYAGTAESCAIDADCASGHCTNGRCCASGECCSDSDECRVGRCVFEICTSGGQCNTALPVPCGMEDIEGTFRYCADGALCDGAGGCDTAIATCDGPYAATGAYTCTPGNVAETCYESCTTDEFCNSGYGCIGGKCVEKLENGNGPCYGNSGCLSNHCNTETEVCCEAGMCCVSNADCDGNTCDPATGACDISCNDGSGDDDAVCRTFGNYHCDDGVCIGDLENGEYSCDEASDCSSGYCDTSLFGICCADDTATCCASSNQCATGFVCVDGQCATDCSPSDTPDNTLCRAGYHCVGNDCAADTPLGAVGCTADADCGDGNKCANNVCCTDTDGDCCRSDAACDDQNPCTDDICLPSYHCVNPPAGIGVPCDADGLFCNGVDMCDGDGNCVAGAPPCQENGICRTDTCNEETDSCEAGTPDPAQEGAACSEPLFCLNDRTKVCDASGNCVDPTPSAGVPCDEESADACTKSICDDVQNECVTEPLPDGTPCNDGDPCTGENRCQDGVCAPGIDLPCEDGDPCTENPCSVVDGQASCAAPVTISDAPCSSGFHCFGDTPMCQDGLCIPSEHICADDMGICTIEACVEQHYGKTDCAPPETQDAMVISCGTSTVITDEKIFATREYYAYGGTCTGNYSGMEAAIGVLLPTDGEVTVTVSDVTPSMTVDLLLLGDWCNPDTCEQSQTGTLSFSGFSGVNVIVLEADGVTPPSGLTITVSDCP